MVKLLLGTSDGVCSLDLNGGDAVQSQGLSGHAVSSLAAQGGVLLAGVRREGLFRSENGSWERVWDEDAHSVIADPRHAGRAYLGVEPAMVLRSDDTGRSWERCQAIDILPSRPSWSFPAPPHLPHVRTFVLHPEEPDTLFAGVEVGGVLRSPDGGETWEELNAGIYEDIHTLALSRANPRRVYACTGAGFYRSTDGGETWSRSMDGLSHGYTVGLVVMPGEEDVLAVAAGTNPPGVNGQVFISRDGGQVWEPAGEGLPAQTARVAALAAAECRLYVGTDAGELYRSEDAGRSWQRLASVGAAIHAVTPVLA